MTQFSSTFEPIQALKQLNLYNICTLSQLISWTNWTLAIIEFLNQLKAWTNSKLKPIFSPQLLNLEHLSLFFYLRPNYYSGLSAGGLEKLILRLTQLNFKWNGQLELSLAKIDCCPWELCILEIQTKLRGFHSEGGV